jgi:hypothetical protein
MRGIKGRQNKLHAHDRFYRENMVAMFSKCLRKESVSDPLIKPGSALIYSISNYLQQTKDFRKAYKGHLIQYIHLPV